jgi:hypothetical protein
MDRLDEETEAVAAASDAPLVTSGSPTIYPLPTEYRKPIRFLIDGETKAFKGRRALMLDLLAKAKSVGIGRAETWRWIGNPGDPVQALKKRGVKIDTRKGQPKCYVLRSTAERIGNAA